jgi:hypothetical protein
MKLFKFVSLAGKKRLERVIKTLQDGMFYCSDYRDLNDPMEGIYKQSGLKDDVLKEIYDAKQKFRICSFSALESAIHQKALPMWAHYANNFCGCAIEIEVEDSRIDSPDSPYRSVKYLSEIDYKNELQRLKEDGKNPADIAKEILRTKLDSWEYENEYRFITSDYKDYHIIGEIKAIWVYLDGRANSGTRRKRRITPMNYRALDEAIRKKNSELKKSHKKYDFETINFKHFAN